MTISDCFTTFLLLLILATPTLGGHPPLLANEGEAPPIRAVVFTIEPLCFKDSTDQWKGLECEILQSFADAIGRELVLLEKSSFPSVGAAMEEGDFDLAMAAITITPERQQVFDFSTGYFPALAFLVERSGEESHQLSDLRGKKVAMLRGTTHEKILRKVSGIELVFGETVQEMYGWLDDGKIKGMVTENIDYLATINIHPHLTASLPVSERQFYGAAMPLGSPLKSAFDAHLQEMKRSGEFRKILASAFGQWGADAIDDLSEGMFDPIEESLKN